MSEYRHQSNQMPDVSSWSDTPKDQNPSLQIPVNSESITKDEDDWMDWETRDMSVPFWKHVVAGSTAGVMEHCVMFPLDTIKTHMQASGRRFGVISLGKILYQEEGLFRFWRGMHIMAAGCVPAHSAYFLTYEKLKLALSFDNEELDFKKTMLIGGLTTFAHDFFVAPSDVVKQRMQLCKNISTRECVAEIIRHEGLLGLVRSYPLTVAMNIPFASTVICCNENLKTMIKPWERKNSYLWYFLCAGLAGGIAGVVTNPLDVVKTRLQVQEVQPSCTKLQCEINNCDKYAAEELIDPELKTVQAENNRINDTVRKSASTKSERYLSARATALYIYQREGLMAFTRGILPRMSINVPATALSWGTYELVKSLLCGTTKE